MSYYGSKPIKQADGGTGQISFTQFGVMGINSSLAIAASAAGTTGTLFSGSATDPGQFVNTLPGSFSFVRSFSGSAVNLSCGNTDNTSSSSNAIIQIAVGGSSSGMPLHQYIQSGGSTSTNYGIVINNAITTPEIDPLEIVNGTTAGSLVNIRYQQSGVINFLRNTCFLAYLPSSVLNATGNGGGYVLGTTGGTALTKIFDQGTNLTTAGVFTAPVTGRFDIRSMIRVVATNSSKVFIVTLITSNRNYQFIHNDISLSGSENVAIEAICDMDVGDTATVTCVVTGEIADNDTISGSASPIPTLICGRLVA